MVPVSLLCFSLWLISGCVEADSATTTNPRVWCYYTNWAQYRPAPQKFVVDNIDPSLCTHFAFAFAVLRKGIMVPFEWNDEDSQWHIGMYTKFNNLRNKNRALKTFLSLGGWNMGSVKFSKMAETDRGRKNFIAKAIPFLRKRKFDGLDLDWEYPANRNGSVTDKHTFTLLVKELLEAFKHEAQTTGKPRLLLSSAVGAAHRVIETAYEVTEISKYLDYINLMTYDFHGAWETVTGHSSPLFSRRDETGNETYWNTAWAALEWLKKGAPIEKINVGIPLYGRTFTLTDPNNHGLGAPAKSAGENGTYTRTAGFLSYFEACELLKSGAKRYYIDEQKVPYLVKGDQWLGYEDVDSIITKVHWIRGNGFPGVMVWSMDLDDFSNSCGGGKYVLSHAIWKTVHDHVKPAVTHPPQVTTPYYSQKPTDSFCAGKATGLYASQDRCSEYIRCVSGAKTIFQCKSGKEWDQNLLLCVTAGTSSTCKKAGGFVRLAGSTVCLNKLDGMYKYDADCKKFIHCQSNTAYLGQCAAGQAFGIYSRTCVTRALVPGC